MAAGTAPSLSQQLSQLISTQLQALKSSPKVPTYDYSNLGQYAIDPKAYAQGIANSTYDPQISGLNHQIDTANGQYGNDVSDINDWYNHALNTYNKGAANASKLYDTASGQLSDSAQAFMSALGGSANPANPGIANQASLEQAMLSGNRQADIGLDTNMQGLIPLAQAQAQTNELGHHTSQISDLNNQLTSAKSAKSAAYNAAFNEGQGKAYDQASGLDQAKFSAANSVFNDVMSRRQANTSDAGTIMNAIITKMLAPGQLAAQNLSNKQAKANINATNTKTNLLNNPGLNINKPGDVAGLQGNLAKLVLNNVIDPNTGSSKLALTGNPKQAWRSVLGQLQNYKIGNNPQWTQVAQNWFKTYLPKGWVFTAKGQLLSPADIKKIHTPTYPAATAPSGTPNNPYNTVPKPKLDNSRGSAAKYYRDGRPIKK